MINASKVKQLTQKLETQGDITLKEADAIYLLFSKAARSTALGPYSHVPDNDLSEALHNWYKTVAQCVEQGKRGNFIFTIVFSENIHFNKLSLPAQQAIKQHGSFEDLCNILVVDEKIYPTLPYKHLFTMGVGDSQTRPYYIVDSDRAGMLHHPIEVEGETYTMGGLIKQFVPIVDLGSPRDLYQEMAMEAFKTIIGARTEVAQHVFVMGNYEVKLFTLATFIRHMNIPCVAAADVHNNRFIVFTEKDKVPIVKYALGVPFEELVQNAVKENAIDNKTAKILTGKPENCPITHFPIKSFTETSIRYLDDIVQKKLDWEAARKTIEGEAEWLAEIR